jgi:hypothetical protein
VPRIKKLKKRPKPTRAVEPLIMMVVMNVTVNNNMGMLWDVLVYPKIIKVIWLLSQECPRKYALAYGHWPIKFYFLTHSYCFLDCYVSTLHRRVAVTLAGQSSLNG